MKLLYKTLPEGICIRRYYSLDGFARIPGQVEGRPVRELDRYAFSETVRGQEDLPGQWEDEPAVKGEGLTALALPQTLRRVGAYAFYNCSQLKSLSFFSTVEDWGAGVFTGCSGLRELDIQLMGGPRSCFKEVLSELRQTLTVSCRDSSGALAARLIFPEFFEESVENTPARILMREMHGCGHMYRYCFEGPEFSFGEYDRLFPPCAGPGEAGACDQAGRLPALLAQGAYKGRGGGVLGLPEGAHEGDGAWAHKEGRAFHTPLADPLPPALTGRIWRKWFWPLRRPRTPGRQP